MSIISRSPPRLLEDGFALSFTVIVLALVLITVHTPVAIPFLQLLPVLWKDLRLGA